MNYIRSRISTKILLQFNIICGTILLIIMKLNAHAPAYS